MEDISIKNEKDYEVEEHISNLNESNQVLNENLEPVSKPNIKIDDKNKPKFDIKNLISKNKKFEELMNMIDNRTSISKISKFDDIKTTVNENKTNKDFDILDINKYIKGRTKTKPKTLQGKIQVIYGEISNLSKRSNCSKSLGPYPKRQISSSRNAYIPNTKVSKKKDIFKPKKDLGINMLSTKEAFWNVQRVGVDKWIGRERYNHQDTFYQEKQSEIKNLLSYVSNCTQPNNLNTIKEYYNVSKKNVTYDSYTSDFYEKELHKFSTKLNKSTDKVINIKATAYNLPITSKSISSFYFSRRINLIKQPKYKPIQLFK